MKTRYNPARGDVKIRLRGRDCILRPSFHAISLMEEHFGRGIIDIARDYHNGKLTQAKDFLALLEAGLKGSGDEGLEPLAEVMVETGLAQLIEPIGLFLAHACGIRR